MDSLLPPPFATLTLIITSSDPGVVTREADIPYPIIPAFAKPIPSGVSSSSSSSSSEAIFSLDNASLTFSGITGRSSSSVFSISSVSNWNLIGPITDSIPALTSIILPISSRSLLAQSSIDCTLSKILVFAKFPRSPK